MNISYYDKARNFGDTLNDIFWGKALGDSVHLQRTMGLLGIGTIVNDMHLCKFKQPLVIAGSGFGYNKLNAIPSATRISFVRGPSTAERLNIPKSFGIGDPAYIADEVLNLRSKSRGTKIAFLPHFETDLFFRWEPICRLCSFRYISPAQTFPEVYSAISTSHLLITESLHGAIVADSLRIPWIPIKTSSNINEFKWQDFMRGIEVESNLVKISPPTAGRRLYLDPKCILNTSRCLKTISNGVATLSSNATASRMKSSIREKLADLKDAFDRDDFAQIPEYVNTVQTARHDSV